MYISGGMQRGAQVCENRSMVNRSWPPPPSTAFIVADRQQLVQEIVNKWHYNIRLHVNNNDMMENMLTYLIKSRSEMTNIKSTLKAQMAMLSENLLSLSVLAGFALLLLWCENACLIHKAQYVLGGAGRSQS